VRIYSIRRAKGKVRIWEVAKIRHLIKKFCSISRQKKNLRKERHGTRPDRFLLLDKSRTGPKRKGREERGYYPYSQPNVPKGKGEKNTREEKTDDRRQVHTTPRLWRKEGVADHSNST